MSITKELFLTALSCPALAWLTNTGQYTKPISASDKFNMEEGLEVHRRAKALFPDGHSIGFTDILTAVAETDKLMADKKTSVIFEATFVFGNFVTRADILKREGTGWKILEVKSSVNVKDELIDDMGYTVMVAKKAGLEVTACSLLLISRDFRLGMSDEKLFIETDHTKEVLARAKEFTDCCDTVSQKLSQDKKPKPELKKDCKGCAIFEECCGQGIKNHIFDLPRLHKTKFSSLVDLDILSIEDIPDDFELTDNQIKVRTAVKSGKPIMTNGLKDALSSISYPAYYLDFETTHTAIPLYPDIAPYTQVPVEYSIHQCSAPGQVVEHFKYLADPSRDCRRELAENLINDCGNNGTVFSYSSFEKSIINGLVKLCPEIEDKLQSLLDRLVDLCAIISKYFYHPDFHGSYSIKKVLPVLVSEMTYEHLGISDGGEAMVAFAYLARGKYTDEEAQKVKNDLLEYCALDTLAMVKLQESLEKLIL